MTALVVLKNGHKIRVPVTGTVESFIQNISKSVEAWSGCAEINCYTADGPLLINFGEVAAIHPAEWEEKEVGGQ